MPAAVLLLVAGLAGLDEGLAWVGRRRGWTRPVAWLAPLFAVFGALLFMVPGVIAYGGQARGTEAAYTDLGRRMAQAGVPLDGSSPVIANHPIWLAEVHRVSTLSLPDEPVASVLDLARTFGAQLVVLDGEPRRRGRTAWRRTRTRRAWSRLPCRRRRAGARRRRLPGLPGGVPMSARILAAR